jgi:hypothetical protein
MDNMKIWDKLSKTDPKYTKSFKGKGGYSGTAINATYQAKQMTIQFGNYGIGWGLENVKYSTEKLSDDFHDNQLVFSADLFYYIDDKKGVIPIDSDLEIWVYSIKYKSWSKNNDMHKKVKTDAMTKGFSLLGLSADVFLGLYDDNKYLNEVRHEFEENKPPIDQKAQVTEITNNIVRSYLTDERFSESLELKEMKKALNDKSLLANQYLVDELIKEYGSLNA